MLIDLSIVVLVSILYYLICSLSRIINLVGGMLLIFLLCWAVGVNVQYETCVSEAGFLIIATIINVWIASRSYYLTAQDSTSRMNKFHGHRHSNHVYTLRNRLNNFRIQSIEDHFQATPQVYLKTMNHQLDQLNQYVANHSNYLQLSQLVRSLQVIKTEIDNINYHFDLPMQVNFPHGLKRLIDQYHEILHEYHLERQAEQQNTVIVDILSHGAKEPAKYNVFLHVNLRFPYQRLIHDRVTRSIDLLVINSRGVFAFTLLNTNARQIKINQNDEISCHEFDSKRYPDLQNYVNLKNKLNYDYEVLDHLIPDKINVYPHVGVICTNPNVKIHLADPQFNVIKPQQLDTLMAKMSVVLSRPQVHNIVRAFRNCFARNKKYRWHVFDVSTESIISKLLWYQNQVKTLNHKLSH